MCLKAFVGTNSNEELYRFKMSDHRPTMRKVNTGDLYVTSRNVAGFAVEQVSIPVEFIVKDPHAIENLGARQTIDQSPAILLSERIDFLLHQWQPVIQILIASPNK